MKKFAASISILVLVAVCVFLSAGGAAEILTWLRDGTNFTIDEETTHVTGPLREDGTVDYIAASNARLESIDPKGNAAVPLAKAFGPNAIDSRIAQEFYRLLRMDPPPPEGEYLIEIDQWIKLKKIEDEELLKKCEGLNSKFWSESDNPVYAE